MKNPIKMNTLLGVLDHSAAVAKKELSDYVNLFKNFQRKFKGVQNTYVPRDGFQMNYGKVAHVQVETTVAEQLEYLIQDNQPDHGAYLKYLVNLFRVEATNSIGAHRVPLIVDGVHYGDLTALELMRLKNVLSDDKLLELIKNIPVRPDTVVWHKDESVDYKDREVYATDLVRNIEATTLKEDYIAKDPNVDPQHLPANYRATVLTKDKRVEIADTTHQDFSGEWTQTQRALCMSRRSRLLEAVLAALKEVNTVDAAEANLDVKGVINFIFDIK